MYKQKTKLSKYAQFNLQYFFFFCLFHFRCFSFYNTISINSLFQSSKQILFFFGVDEKQGEQQINNKEKKGKK